MNGKISNLSQIAYVRRYTLTGGKEDGLRVIEVNNGKLRFLLNESKALDVMQAWHNGVNLSFVSKNGFTKRELPFGDRFEGGMVYTCGLDNLGDHEGYDTHGSIHNIPALVTECKCDEGGIKIVADIEDTTLYGKNLLLRRTVTTDVLGDTLSICDRLINRGTKTEGYALLYHTNVGYPMLDAGVKIVSDATEAVPRSEFSKIKIAEREIFPDNVDNEEERCYYINVKKPEVKVVNEKLGKTLTLTYSAETLPVFVQWCSAGSQDYALGIEAGTSTIDGEFERKPIKAGEEITFNINLTIT